MSYICLYLIVGDYKWTWGQGTIEEKWPRLQSIYESGSEDSDFYAQEQVCFNELHVLLHSVYLPVALSVNGFNCEVEQ